MSSCYLLLQWPPTYLLQYFPLLKPLYKAAAQAHMQITNVLFVYVIAKLLEHG